jgi:hypothetical protein
MLDFDSMSVEDVFMFSDIEDAEFEKAKRLKKRDELINTMGALN